MRSYLDHNATSTLRPEAKAAMLRAMDCTGNASSVHGEGRAARKVLDDAREQVARMRRVRRRREAVRLAPAVAADDSDEVG